MSANSREALDPMIAAWRTHVGASGAAAAEAELRDQLVALTDSGLAPDEAFLVALTRLAARDDATRAFAREYASRQWPAPTGTTAEPASPDRARADLLVMLACALGAAIAVKVPTFFGIHLDGPDGQFYMRNVSLLVLPFLGAYLAYVRRLGAKAAAALVTVFAGGAVVANALPWVPGGSTETLLAIHLPIALWLALGVSHAGGRWRERGQRMEFVRFTGESIVNYTLIALGGGVLMSLTAGVFAAIGLDASAFVAEWMAPCGAAAAVVVAGWLADSRRSLAGGMAPMLARVFTPLFTVLLVALLIGVIGTAGVMDIEREVLILLDLLLVVVLALLLYVFSARDPKAGRGALDWIQLVLVVCALFVDAVALVNIAGRLAEYGLSANRAAALGLNLILLVNLAWSAVLQTRFVRARDELESVTGWQMRYLPVYALWAAVVAIVFPLVFQFA